MYLLRFLGVRRLCFLLVWLCSQPCCYARRMQWKSVSMFFGLEQRWRSGLAFQVLCWVSFPWIMLTAETAG